MSKKDKKIIKELPEKEIKRLEELEMVKSKQKNKKINVSRNYFSKRY